MLLLYQQQSFEFIVVIQGHYYIFLQLKFNALVPNFTSLSYNIQFHGDKMVVNHTH